jgi:diguanylate cyclase (GGDEF)-like protein
MAKGGWTNPLTLARSFGAVALLFLALLPSLAWGEGGDAWAKWQWAAFSRIGGDAGLPHVTATAITRAPDGTMWIGTRGGLVRYDGQRLRSFKQRLADPHSLPDNYIRSLLALPDGSIMVGTNVGGTARYDPGTGQFRRLKAIRGRIGARVYGFTPDGRGGAYIGSDGGVHHYVRQADAIDPMAEQAIHSPDGRPQGSFSIHRDADGTLWAGCEEGLWMRRPGASRFELVELGKDRGKSDIWSILRDGQGRLWVGTGADGLYLSTGRDQPFRVLPGLDGASALVGHRTVRALVQDGRGRIWVGTDGMGIILIDPAQDFAGQPIRHLAANPFSLVGDTVRSLALDGSGGIWAATELGAARTQGPGGGVLRIGSAMPDPHMSLSDENVRGIMVDRHDRIWLGLSKGGVDRLDRAAGEVRRIALEGRHAGQDIKALLESDDGTILVGARGVVAIDPKSLRQRPVPVTGLDDLPVISLAETPDLLLIGTYKGLFVRRRANGVVLHLQHDAANPNSLPNNEVINIVIQPGLVALIATPGGIGRLDLRTGRFTNFASRAGDATSLPQDYAGSIIPFGRDIWVGTYGGVGYGQAVPGGWQFRAITEAQGLAGDNVASLVRDRRDRLWVASTGGISLIDPAGRHVRVMSRRDGLTMGAFNQRAAARTADGSLLFGSPDGLLVLQPDLLLGQKAAVDPARMIVSGAELDGHALPGDPVSPDFALRLNGNERTLRVGFALTDYAAPDEVRYRYRLEGFDRQWMNVPAGTPASATYTNLPAGEYWLDLRASVPGLAAKVVSRRLRLIVEPQWYESWPARVGLAILAIVSLGGVILLVTAVVRRRARMLEVMVEERTGALRAANAQLDLLASTDPLTGLANRRTLMAATQDARDHAVGEGEAFSFALLDLDHFKRINDEYGHGAGDEVLIETAARLRQGVRGRDMIARYGGEEIAILFPAASIDAAAGVVERLRKAVAERPIVVDGRSIPVTFSGGVAEWRDGEDIETTIRRADHALYHAKGLGRDRVGLAI